MRRTPRLIAAVVLIAFTGVLGGCSSGGFDPSDLLDFLDTKKKLPGERKPVFPDGVPGLEQGVPKELYKDQVEQQQRQDQENADAAAAAAAAPPPEPAKPAKTAKSKKTRAPAVAAKTPADTPAAEADGEAQPTAVPPPPKHKIVRRRTTAPPPDQTTTQDAPLAQTTQPQSATPFPAPLPSGSFQH